jgi:hypothetical protein
VPRMFFSGKFIYPLLVLNLEERVK